MRLFASIAVVTILLLTGCSGNDGSPEPTPAPAGQTAESEETEPAGQPLIPAVVSSQADKLTDTTWILSDVEDNTEEWGYTGRFRIELEFRIDNGRYFLNGFSGCNTFTGTFDVNENAMYVDDLSTTRKSCSETCMNQEQAFLSALHEAHSFHFTDDDQNLVIAYGMTTPSRMIFRPAPPQPGPTPTPGPSPKPAPTPQTRPGTIMAHIYLGIQQSGTQATGCREVPVNIGFYPPGSDRATLRNPQAALFYFSGTTDCTATLGGTRTMVTVGPVNPGTYDITADSPTTLMNVKRNIHIE